MIRVSHSSIASTRRSGAEQADTARRVGASVRQNCFSQQGLYHRAAYGLGQLRPLLRGSERPPAGHDRHFGAIVDDVSRLCECRARGMAVEGAAQSPLWFGMLAPLRSCRTEPAIPECLSGCRCVRPPVVRSAVRNRLIHNVHRVRRAHNPLVKYRDIHEELVEIDILLVVHTDQIVKGMSGDGEYRLAIAFGIVESVQQMNAARPGRGAHTPSRPEYFA